MPCRDRRWRRPLPTSIARSAFRLLTCPLITSRSSRTRCFTVSAYHLTIEPNTLFHRHPPPLPDDEMSADMQQAVETRLADAGYRHYETSAFAKSGREARHNLNYWTFGDYLGIGAGAHGKLSYADRILRQMRYKQPREYMEKAQAGLGVQQEQVVAADDLPFQFMMNALPLIPRSAPSSFPPRTPFPLHLSRTALH